MDPSDRPAQWVSKYGSVTFNQYGREMPCGGMNEAGLVMETMTLPETKYPSRDARPAVMAWLQCQLDTCATVDEVTANDKRIRPATITPMPIHFLGCDRQGAVATFEFLDGRLVSHKAEELPVMVLANDTYDKSLAYLKQHAGFGGTKKIPYGSWGSLDRFVCASDRIKAYPSFTGGSIVEYAFDTLQSVRLGDMTKWMIVYDLTNMTIHYKTCTCSKTRTIRFSGCDFDSETPAQVISINTPYMGLLNPHFYHYDTDLNRWLVYYSIKHTKELAFIPDAYLEMLIRYPEAPAAQYLTDWEAAGPFQQEGKSCQELLDIAFSPEQSDSDTQWRTLPVELLAAYPGYLDLDKAMKGGSQTAAYLRTQIVSDKQEPVRLEIYSDDGVKAWLNGEIVHRNNVIRGIASQPDTVEATLKKGVNLLMLKVTQSEGPWGAIVRLKPAVPVQSPSGT
jgi:choloylglycine hydrolase